MLSILADALMIATGHAPSRRAADHHDGRDWNDRFISARMQGLDYQGHRFSTRRDLNW